MIGPIKNDAREVLLETLPSQWGENMTDQEIDFILTGTKKQATIVLEKYGLLTPVRAKLITND